MMYQLLVRLPGEVLLLVKRKRVTMDKKCILVWVVYKVN